MSIAELIMTGTNRASESTAWVGDSLAKIGQNVGQALAQREQKKQAQEMLPFLQQNMQDAMELAQSGKSGEAYSKMLGAINPQMMNNPQMLPFIKLGFDAIDKSANDFISSQKTGGSSLVDYLIAKELGLPLPTGGGADGGEGGQVGDNPTTDLTSPVAEVPLPTGGGFNSGGARMFPSGGSPDAKNTPPSAIATPSQAGTNLIDDIATWKPPTQKAQPQPTPEQVQAATYKQQNQKIEETQGIASAWYNDAVPKDSPKLKQLDQTHEPINLKGADQFNFGTMYFPKEKDLNKEMRITGQGNNFNLSMDRNKVDTAKEKERRNFKDNIVTALGLMNSAEITKLLDQFGSVDNFPTPIRSDKNNIIFKYKNKEGKVDSVKLPLTGDVKNMRTGDAFDLLKNAPGYGRGLGILIARSGEMPQVGIDRKAKAAQFLRE